MSKKIKKIEEIQRGKTVTSYGGIGTLIETRENGCVQILPFDQWPLYINRVNQGNLTGISFVNDERLVARLRRMGFSQLNRLFMPCTHEELDHGIAYKVDRNNDIVQQSVGGKLMPEWMYCPKCRKLQHVESWMNQHRNWRQSGICCTNNGAHRPRKNAKVEQVRFVLASMTSGELRDIPWSRLFSNPTSIPITDQNGANLPDAWSFTMQEQEVGVWYCESKSTDSIYGIRVSNYAPRTPPNANGRSFTMAELMRHYFIIDGHAYRVVLRNGNNICFPYTYNSIYIPDYITQEVATQIRQYYNILGDTATVDKICATLALQNIIISNSKMQGLINANFNVGQLPVDTDSDYLNEEFEYIVDANNYDQNNLCCKDDNFVAERFPGINPLPSRVKALYCLRTIKETTVQLGYSRIEKGFGVDLKSETSGLAMKSWLNVNLDPIQETDKLPIALRKSGDIAISNLLHMPAVEALGEGLFVELDEAFMDDISVANDERFKFMHTYCHLIMKELEFECGYTLTSMKERLYYLPSANNGQHGKYGFMIYSISGGDGSYGGITSLFDNNAEQLLRIFSNAKERARDCSNDPICSTDNDHPGACFACVYLPETSCIEFNQKLNRSVFTNHINPQEGRQN